MGIAVNAEYSATAQLLPSFKGWLEKFGVCAIAKSLASRYESSKRLHALHLLGTADHVLPSERSEITGLTEMQQEPQGLYGKEVKQQCLCFLRH